MRRLLPLSAAALALAACSLDVHKSAGNDAGDAVHIALAKDDRGANDVSMNLPFVDARFNLPQLGLANHMDLDGIRLAPDTEVRGVDVRGGRGANDAVRVDFVNPRPPAALLDHYRRAAIGAGYTPQAGSGADALHAVKGRQTFALSLAPDGAGSRGRIAMYEGD